MINLAWSQRGEVRVLRGWSTNVGWSTNGLGWARPYGPVAHWEINEFFEEDLRHPEYYGRDRKSHKYPWWTRMLGREQEKMFNKKLPHDPDTAAYLNVTTSKTRYPEYNLVLGVMRESLMNLAQPNRLNGREQDELWAWWQREDDEPFSFNHLCQVLDIDPSITRRAIVNNVVLQGTDKLKDALGNISKGLKRKAKA